MVSPRWQHVDVDGRMESLSAGTENMQVGALLNFTVCSMTSQGTGQLNIFIRTLSRAFY